MIRVRGLPGPLPAGERLLWQGAPDRRVLARKVLHIRKLIVYFACIAIWMGCSKIAQGTPLGEAALKTLFVLLVGAVPVGLVAVYSWLVARNTIYTITNRRVALHIGLALPVTINLPFAQIASADLSRRADGSGDLSVTLNGHNRFAYIVLWPHARPWRFAPARPTLRALPDALAVAQLLARALAASADMAAPVLQGAPAATSSVPHATMPA